MLFDPVEKAKQLEEKSKDMSRKATLFQRIEHAIKSFSQELKIY